MRPRVQIQQALFGYELGHNLISTSFTLPPDATRALAVASDLPGPAPANGFDGSITGMPLESLGVYVLFCTWLAPEMPRPGCVWSHVLFIGSDSLAQIGDLQLLRSVFRRPLGLDDDSYRHPVVVDASDAFARSAPVDLDRDVLLSWAVALYGGRNSIVCFSESATQYEKFIFALWSQQWPELRKTFRFSTGSFADRGTPGRPFDVQVAPLSQRGGWVHRGSKFVVDPPLAVLSRDARWAAVVADDLHWPGTNGFREFLASASRGVRADRPSFASLARVFDAIRSGDMSPIEVAAEEFPGPEEALELKQVAFAAVCERNDLSDVENLLEVVFPSRPGTLARSFEKVDIDVDGLVRRLWPNHRGVVLDSLRSSLSEGVGSRAKALAIAVAAAVDSGDIEAVEDRPELLAGLVKIRPGIANKPAVWRLSERTQLDIVERLEELGSDYSGWASVVEAMLSAGSAVAADDVANMAGRSAFSGALSWFRTTSSLPPRLWRGPLYRSSEDLRRERPLSPLEWAFVAAIGPASELGLLSPFDAGVQEFARLDWTDLPSIVRVPAAFLLVTLGLKGNGAVGGPLLARGFFLTHSALAAQSEPSESWRLLQRQLPDTSWWGWEWDRCRRLRHRTSEWLRQNPTASGVFARGATTEGDRLLAERVLSSA